MLRLVSLVFLVCVWHIAFLIVGERMLPGPLIVLAAIRDAAASGTLFLNLGITLGRVLAAFALSMFAGTVLGLLMGRVTLADRIGDPWLVLLLNLPALVIIVLAYVWGGLTEI